MTRKETLLLRTYELRNAIRTAKGKTDELYDLEALQNEYSFRRDAQRYKEYELKVRIEELEAGLESVKLEEAAKAEAARFFATEEGAARKAELEQQKAAAVAELENLEMAKLTGLDIIVKANLGNHWKVTHLSTTCCYISTMADGKEVFGQGLEIMYDRKDWFTGAPKFEVNVGSCGSFDMTKHEIGDRARFYMDLGRLLANQSLLETLKKSLFDYAAEMERLYGILEGLNKKLANPTK